MLLCHQMYLLPPFCVDIDMNLWLYLTLAPQWFRKHGPILPTWIDFSLHHKGWGEIIYPFSNFNGGTIEVWGWVSYFTPHLPWIWLFIHAEIKVNLCWWRPPGDHKWSARLVCGNQLIYQSANIILSWHEWLWLISPWTKLPPFLRRYFQIHFRGWKVSYLNWNFTEFCS